MEGLHIGKIKICRLHQRVHVISSVKFTFKTSIIQMPAMLIIVAQDTKIGEYIDLAFKLTEQPGKQFRPKQLHIQAVSKTGTYFKVKFCFANIFISNSTKFITNNHQNLAV